MEFTNQPPFKKLLIHATVLTKDGKRMSKSLGTGINPLDLIEKYGADALRFGLAYQTTGVQDMRFNEDAILMGKKFANKVWNIARYVMAKVEDGANVASPTFPSEAAPIIKTMKETVAAVTKNIEEYNFGEAAHLIYDFVWHDFADKYIEETKSRDDKETKDALAYLLINCLKLLHPFMPFVTEEIYSRLSPKNPEKLPRGNHGAGKTLLLVEEWPLEHF
jgi:valyl-tRNA synthetase